MQSIGERLEEARKRKGISIREAAEATKIRGDYLHKFEGNQFDLKLPEIYIRGFLKTYAVFLKAPADKILADYKALGLDEHKGVRGLNREVYGRMDLTVGSKMDKESGEGGQPGATEPVATNADAGPRNPSTFTAPRPAGRAPFDRDLAMKAGILVLGLAVVIILGIALLGRSGSDKPALTTTAAASTDITWAKPQAGEPILTLVALNSVKVTVTAINGDQILYQGTIPRGDHRDVPRRGRLRIVADPYQSLEFEIAGKRYPPAGAASEIFAP